MIYSIVKPLIFICSYSVSLIQTPYIGIARQVTFSLNLNINKKNKHSNHSAIIDAINANDGAGFGGKWEFFFCLNKN